MVSSLLEHTTLANVIAIVALALVPFNTRIRRTYSPSLDLVQMSVVFRIVLTPKLELFSGNLDYSWASFVPNLLTYCSE